MVDPTLNPPTTVELDPGRVYLFLSTEENDLESAVIRWNSLSLWSHSGWVRPSDMYTFSAMNDGKGVSWRIPNPRARMLILDAPGTQEAFQAALSCEGDPYDTSDILGMVFAKNWHKPGAWICSYLTSYHYRLVGYPLFSDYIPLIHIKPYHHLLIKEVRVVKEINTHAH